ncbi:hypothetical protein IP91_01603 [Pseudoduganella lurida]|uniref:Uncharacterized protein n=1 Tax=Pseudoduganella lurida TaxID=1036180 RepID=A0A562RGF1_9BURK|nr:DUF6289 family protein [Pseudoduganella lurida]TWI67490.1 hypothetical protein IP91_01603 [Pseudoduganella lurida]
MLKKIALSVAVVVAVIGAASAYASRPYSIDYGYYDDNGSLVGEAYLPCSGHLIMLGGEVTANMVEQGRQPCH